MFNDDTLGQLERLKDTNGRPLFGPYELSAGEVPRIWRKPYVINQDVASMGVSALSIYYGDFSPYLMIRDALGMEFYRFDQESVYVRKRLVGFLMYTRAAANWIDIGGAAKTFKNAAS